MHDTSPRLSLPLIMPSQAQKHVTHNEAVVLLDGLVQLTLLSVGANAPPASGADGEAHGVGPAPTGLWKGKAGHVAIRSNGGWVFAMPARGWRAYDLSAGASRLHDGTGWVEDVPALQDLGGVGIGTGSDATNRLAVSSDAALFSHAGGDMRLKVNRAGAGGTASLLFQSGWSGRAEMGLAGGEDFEVKVSADGAAWSAGLRIEAATGTLEAPAGIALGPGTLAHYEDAPWSPVPSASTAPAGAAATATGRAVRVGALVHARFELTLDDPGTGGAGPVRIEGLPHGGSGPAAGSAMLDGGAPLALALDGGALLPVGPGGALDWSDLSPGAVLTGAASYIAI